MSETFRLGRDCTFALNGTVLRSVREVGVRRVTNEIDATGFGHSARSTAVIHRTYEIDVAVLKPADFDALKAAEEGSGIVTVTTANGLRPVSANFMVCESSADEPLDSNVVGTFTLKQWMHGT